ncbi:MAG: hypothetical protein ACREH8_03415 [Opitutaceae bacterium]
MSKTGSGVPPLVGLGRLTEPASRSTLRNVAERRLIIGPRFSAGYR